MLNTALSAKMELITQTVTFRKKENNRVYIQYLLKCMRVFCIALVYGLKLRKIQKRV